MDKVFEVAAELDRVVAAGVGDVIDDVVCVVAATLRQVRRAADRGEACDRDLRHAGVLELGSGDAVRAALRDADRRGDASQIFVFLKAVRA